MALNFELFARGEAYKDKNGDDKNYWIKCGVVIDNKSGGQSIKLESLPVNFDGWLVMKEPKPKDNKPDNATESKPALNQPPVNENESIPF